MFTILKNCFPFPGTLGGYVEAHRGGPGTLSHARGPRTALIPCLGFEVTHDSLLVYSSYLIGPINPPSEMSLELSPSSLHSYCLNSGL